jgi:hypothetical protein
MKFALWIFFKVGALAGCVILCVTMVRGTEGPLERYLVAFMMMTTALGLVVDVIYDMFKRLIKDFDGG